MEAEQIGEIQRALELTPASTAWERTADITTYGRRSGQPHRMETWFYRFEDRTYLSGLPGRRDWLANLRADPRLIFHLRHGVQADLPATAVVITDDELRRRAFTQFVADLNQRHDPARIGRATDLAAWMAGSPLVQVRFDDGQLL